MTTILVSDYETPVGRIRAAAHRDSLVAVAWTSHWDPVAARLHRRMSDVRFVDTAPCRPIERYLAGECDALDEVPVDPGGTDFQREVWAQLRRIPGGRTVSYRELAHRIGRPRASRAVGAANGANPVWIVIPCHRVVGIDGSLRGYAGGLDRKEWLLDHERRHATP